VEEKTAKVFPPSFTPTCMIDFNAAPFYIIHNIPFPIYKNVFVFFNVSKKIARLLVSIVILYSQQGMQQLEKRFAGENYESTVLTPFGSYFEQNSNEQKKKKWRPSSTRK
jgi:hypothetical protein